MIGLFLPRRAIHFTIAISNITRAKTDRQRLRPAALKTRNTQNPLRLEPATRKTNNAQ